MRYLYRPNHPKADKFGMVEWSLGIGPLHPAVYVISDTMDMVKHHGSGRMFDSKSNFRKETKACGMVEVGNEPIKQRKQIRLDKGQRRDAIRKAIYELRNR